MSITTGNEICPEAPQELLLFTGTNEVTSRRLILQRGSSAQQHRCRPELAAAPAAAGL